MENNKKQETQNEKNEAEKNNNGLDGKADVTTNQSFNNDGASLIPGEEVKKSKAGKNDDAKEEN